MVNETSGATVARLTPVVSISRPEMNQAVSGVAKEAQALPVQGKDKPQVQLVQSPQSSSDIREAVTEINEFVQTIQRDLSFNMDEVSGKTVIKVIDRDSGDTVRQIPSEEVLQIARSIRDVRENAVGREVLPSGLLFSRNT